jgi:hypothetical protein
MVRNAEIGILHSLYNQAQKKVILYEKQYSNLHCKSDKYMDAYWKVQILGLIMQCFSHSDLLMKFPNPKKPHKGEHHHALIYIQ